MTSCGCPRASSEGLAWEQAGSWYYLFSDGEHTSSVREDAPSAGVTEVLGLAVCLFSVFHILKGSHSSNSGLCSRHTLQGLVVSRCLLDPCNVIAMPWTRQDQLSG